MIKGKDWKTPCLSSEQAQSIRGAKGLTREDYLKCFSLRQFFFQWPRFLHKWQIFLESEGFDLVCWSLWEEFDSCWSSKFMILVASRLFEFWIVRPNRFAKLTKSGVAMVSQLSWARFTRIVRSSPGPLLNMELKTTLVDSAPKESLLIQVHVPNVQ